MQFNEVNEVIRKNVSKVGRMLNSGATDGEELGIPDAIEFLTSQHREVESLFEELEGTGDKALKTRERLLASITEKLKLHTKLEELFFYPEAKIADKDLVLEAAEEHQNVKTMLRRIGNTKVGDETFMAKVITLRELVKHHVKEEETDLFPKCRSALGHDKLAEIGQKMAERTEAVEHA